MPSGPRWLARAGAPRRLPPDDPPPWEAAYRQTRRRLEAGVFEAAAHDLREPLRRAEAISARPGHTDPGSRCART
jgi:transposase